MNRLAKFGIPIESLNLMAQSGCKILSHAEHKDEFWNGLKRTKRFSKTMLWAVKFAGRSAQITPTGPALPEFCRFDEKVRDHRKISISNFF
ncbi:hypothetical protein HPC62_05605 [Thermoleptolyngbya sichuanensis A183]|uniref:Uncharacterized protein n=1 Tax=Thermoleptolyngbya sichuanensis A183 TaxID=2737172 RepID=A0A6M8B5J7_9CYAN|nr:MULTISPECIES: hypothetical protein [Thermoleptolyngbya]QKD81738.1 hypothetical protein HPC62_05605 [Thermoleptolyngbya sichuanensis A183]